LAGIPAVDAPGNLDAALRSDRTTIAVLTEILRLRQGGGSVTPQEYFYYRLWEPELSYPQKQRFVGKIAQHRMHIAVNDRHWFQAAADKILWHTVMAGARLPVPQELAVTQANRRLVGASPATDPAAIAALLRRADAYPLFAKPVAGKYSLGVLSADAYDQAHDTIVLLDGSHRPVGDVAASLTGGSGYLLQRRLSQAPQLATLFGPRLWSVRVLVFVRQSGPVIHRAVAKIATGTNPADNYWRSGNMLGAIDLSTGIIRRAVRGSGKDLTVNPHHPETGEPIHGTPIPGWSRLVDLVMTAALVFAGIRTQSWDIALTDHGPVFLELNYGGDLNLAQLANGEGVLDAAYVEHLRECGYRI
jgi:hypothetical protein